MWETIKRYAWRLLLPLAAGGAAALLTAGNRELYDTLVRPPLAPPAVLFPVVWTVLYLLMGVGYVLVYQKREEMPEQVKAAQKVFLASLAVNFFWSILFFNFRAFLVSFLWILLLWGLILKTILDYRKISRPAAFLQIPYLLWVTFAAYLNGAIFFLNR